MRSLDNSFADRWLGAVQISREDLLMTRKKKGRDNPIILEDLETAVQAVKNVEAAIPEPEVMIDDKPATVAQLKLLVEKARKKVVVEFENREKDLVAKLETAIEKTAEANCARDNALGLAANARKRLSVVSRQLKQERKGKIGIRKPLPVKEGC